MLNIAQRKQFHYNDKIREKNWLDGMADTCIKGKLYAHIY